MAVLRRLHIGPQLQHRILHHTMRLVDLVPVKVLDIVQLPIQKYVKPIPEKNEKQKSQAN